VTEAEFEDVDLDRLADFAGGAYEGTPDAAAVARVVATDPAWTRAHAELVAADALVRADLAVLAGEPEPMPADIMIRLGAALAAEPLPPTARERPHVSVLSGGRTARARSRPRWHAVVGVAAAVLVIGVGAATVMTQLSQSPSGLTAGTKSRSTAGDTSAKGAPGTQPPFGARGDAARSPAINASGVDYTAASLAILGARPATAAGPDSTGVEPPSVPAASQPSLALTDVPGPLRPLTEPAIRNACLQAIVTEYGGTATLLDYARYQGSPALIVLIDGAYGVAGRKWAVVVGPTCGAGGVIADLRHSAQVG
jgi:hypothetical protein